MNYKYGKVFKKNTNDQIVIEIVDYDPSVDDYYSMIMCYRKSGYSQVIITSEAMVALLKEYFYVKKCKITGIELMEEDGYLKKEIQSILQQLKEDRGYFNVLLEKIVYLVDENSIDLRKIEFTWRVQNRTISFFIQVNGVLGISNFEYSSEVENFARLILESVYV